MDAAEYKHLVLGLIFLKYISDSFAEHQEKVLKQVSDPSSEMEVHSLAELKGKSGMEMSIF